MDTQALLARVYSAFNRRDIDGTLALMAEDVSWPKASEGGRVVGKQAIREYWTRQWADFDPHVEVLQAIVQEDGRTLVRVRQLVKNLDGETLSDSEVGHIYTFRENQIQRMDLANPDGVTTDPAAAFSGH